MFSSPVSQARGTNSGGFVDPCHIYPDIAHALMKIGMAGLLNLRFTAIYGTSLNYYSRYRDGTECRDASLHPRSITHDEDTYPDAHAF